MKKAVINKYLRKFGLELHGTGYMQAISKSTFKEDAFERQRQLLPGNVKTIFDIGANRGDVTLNYHRLFENANIFSFEPFPESYKILTEKTRHLPNIKAEELGMSDQPGRAVLNVNANVDTNSLLKSYNSGLSSDAAVKNVGNIEINLSTVDNYCAARQLDYIDILKLDIQGGELNALKGAESLLRQKRIGLIYTEAYFRQQYEAQPLFYEIASYLNQNGYLLQDIYNPIYGKGSIAWCDAIFIPAGD